MKRDFAREDSWRRFARWRIKGGGVLRYGGFMARARTRMVGGGSCTLRCFCSSWSAVTHDGSAMVLENEDKNEDERGM